MSVTDEQIVRIHERLDGIEKNLETRLRALEIWQAYQMGRLTALAVFFSALGALVLWAANLFARHIKMLALVGGALAVMLLSGCATNRHPQARVSVAIPQAHIDQASEYVAAATVSTTEAKRAVARIATTAREVRDAIPDQPAKAQLEAKLQAIEEGASQANAELETVTMKLESAKAEAATVRVALADTQTKINALEAFNVCLTKDRDAAVSNAQVLKKSNDTLAGRLARAALVIAGCAAMLMWMFSRALGLKALPVPYCYAWPGLAAAGAGAAVFTYVRFLL